MNNKYKVIVEAPLIRAGLTIETECSEKYLSDVVDTLLNKVRDINSNDSKSIDVPPKD